jgi:hypothetical protein
MDVTQFKACVTCAETIDRDQVPSLSSSNGFTYPLFIYSNTDPSLITFLTLILVTKVPQSLFSTESSEEPCLHFIKCYLKSLVAHPS